MNCAPSSIEVDLAASGWFTFTCTITTPMSSAFAASVEWQTTTSIAGETSGHLLTFTSATGNSQTVTFSGNAKVVGDHQLLMSVTEPGADYPMDTVTVVIEASDSNAPVAVSGDGDNALLTTLSENTMVQAALAGLVLFVLMGTLMIRGQSRKAREDERRMMRAAELRQSRGLGELPSRQLVQQQHQPRAPRERTESLFSDFRSKR